MIIALEDAKYKLIGMRADIEDLGSALRINDLKALAEELDAKTLDPDFWSNQENSSKVLQKLKQTKDTIEGYETLAGRLEDAITLAEMAIEENEEGYVEEIQSELNAIAKEAEEKRIEILLSGEYDKNNAIVSFHPGAGGTEAQDWAQMLYRMITRWAERRGYKYKLLDWLDGDAAGIKSATIMVEGLNAYGYLKAENGVHRLVRVSPLTPQADVRPPSPPSRLCPSLITSTRSRSVTRTSRSPRTAPAEQADSTSIRPTPPSESSTSPRASW